MKIYFTESYFMDYSRVGYNSVSIVHSLKNTMDTEEGSSYSSSWYYLEVDDSFTEEEANKLASEASYLAVNSSMSVREALKQLELKYLNIKKSKKGN